MGATAALAWYGGMTPGPAVFLGFLMALSSTAIVLKLLQDKAEMDSAQGRAALAVLIFQDVIAVVMLLVAPHLAEGGGSAGPDWGLMTRGLVALAVLVACYRWVAPMFSMWWPEPAAPNFSP